MAFHRRMLFLSLSSRAKQAKCGYSASGALLLTMCKSLLAAKRMRGDSEPSAAGRRPRTGPGGGRRARFAGIANRARLPPPGPVRGRRPAALLKLADGEQARLKPRQ